MKHIKQKTNQCWLAAICMVEGLNYDKWSRYYPTTEKNILISEWQHKLISSLAVWYNTESFKGKYDVMPMDDSPDLSGRGVIIVGDMHGNHAVAFENGLIYNPNQTKPYTWEEFIKHSKNQGRYWGIKDIQRKPEGVKK